MRIATVGNGNIGGTLGRPWAEAGHEVLAGVREPDRETGEVSVNEAIETADVELTEPRKALDDAGAETHLPGGLGNPDKLRATPT